MRRQVFGLNHPRTFDFRKERGVVEARGGEGEEIEGQQDGSAGGGGGGGGTDDMHYVSNNVTEEVRQRGEWVGSKVERYPSSAVYGRPCVIH